VKRLLVFVVLIVGLVVASVAVASAVPIGEVAPDFEGVTLEGKQFKLSDYRGEPILLKIGTTWCPSCREQTRAIDTLHDYLTEKGVRFVDVFVDESGKSVNKYFAKGKYHNPAAIVLDEGAAHKAYNVYVIPRLVLIDRNFLVVRDGDTLTSGSLKKKLEKMLGSD
jgi:peroxiredoxin